jgi:hypothetical protein
MTTGTTTTAVRIAALALLAGGLTGCGGGDAASAPTDASRGEFCEAYASQIGSLARSAREDGPDRAAEAMRDWSTRAQEIGTPGDMPEDARRGFETIVEEIDALGSGPTQRELDALGEDLGTRAQRDLEAFGEYAVSTCPEAVERLMGEMSDQLEGEMGRLEDQLGEELGDLDLGDLEGQLP